MKKIIAVGNALVDVLVRDFEDDNLHELGLCRGGMTLIDKGEAFRIERLLEAYEPKTATGGSAANTALALAMQGDAVAFFGCVGDDPMWAFFANGQKNKGVQPLLQRLEGVKTGVAYTFIAPDGERSFATHLGAAAMMTPAIVKAQLEPVLASRAYHIIYIEGYLVQNHKLMLAVLQAADLAGMEIALDLASYNVVLEERDFFRQILTDYVDIVFANEEEALAYAFGGGSTEGIDDHAATAAAILGRTCRVAVVKRGSAGAVFHDDATEGSCPAVPVKEVVDTTGAGDFFAGGFLHAYAQGLPTQQCVELGAQMAAKVIQVVGTDVRTKI